MKTTYSLYRCSPLLWADLEYEAALEFRIAMAREAMGYYRKESRKISSKWTHARHEKLERLTVLYTASEDAVKWNQIFLDEITKEREDKYELKNYECEDRTLPNQRTQGPGIQRQSSNKGILSGPREWLKRYLP